MREFRAAGWASPALVRLVLAAVCLVVFPLTGCGPRGAAADCGASELLSVWLQLDLPIGYDEKTVTLVVTHDPGTEQERKEWMHIPARAAGRLELRDSATLRLQLSAPGHASTPVLVDRCTESVTLRLRSTTGGGDVVGFRSYALPPEARGFRSLAEDRERGQVLLVDPLKGTAQAFDIASERWAGKWEPGASLPALRAIEAYPEGFLVRTGLCEAVLLRSGRLTPLTLCTERWRLPGAPLGPPLGEERAPHLTALFGHTSWLPDGTGIGHGVLRHPGGESGWGGVVRVRHDPARSTLVQPELIISASSAYYRLGYPYFTAIGEEVYFVHMLQDRPPELYRISKTGGPELLPLPLPHPYVCMVQDLESATPAGASLLPRLPGLTGVAGLYSDEDSLYVLTREPWDGATRWLVHPLRPGAAEAGEAVKLPTRAPHLNLLVTPGAWWIAERGERSGDARSGDRLVRLMPG